MNRTAGLWIGYLTLAVLAACVPKDPTGPDEKVEGMGSAEVTLPAIPPGFLSKRAADSSDPMFVLTISGEGMGVRKQAWPLEEGGGTFRVANIPAGKRTFVGELESGGKVAYADTAVAAILAGQTAEVRLRLKAATGNAKICVEIEGLPPAPGCEPVKPFPEVSGCFIFTLPGHDSSDLAFMRLLHKDGRVEGEIEWANGQRDSSIGTITRDGWLSMGLESMAQSWVFSGQFDTTTNQLHGKFFRRNGEPYAVVFITAGRGPCELIPRPPLTDSSMTCYDVGQNLDASSWNGRLVLYEKSTILYGYFIWSGATAMPVTGQSAPVNGNKGLYLYGNLPAALSKLPINQSDKVHYKGQVGQLGFIDFGTIYGMNAAPVQRGTWKGSRSHCENREAILVREMHHL